MSLFTPTRTCSHCGKTADPRAKRCQNCHKLIVATSEAATPMAAPADRPARPQAYEATSDVVIAAASSRVSAAATARAIARYRDAYAIAKSVDTQGQMIKTLAAIVAGIIFLIALIATAKLDGEVAIGAFLMGAVASALIWLIVHSYGVRVAAGAQELLATLDVAVHTSPFLSDGERAEAMSL